MRNVERRRQFYKSFEAQALKSRSLLTQIADDLTNIFGSATFLILNFIWFILWIGINTSVLPIIPVFDPFPFGLLTMIVSLEAIILSVFVLISQNRSAYITSLREEVHMRVNLIAEEEITKALQLLSDMRKKLGITSEDPELDEMLKRIDTGYIERKIIEQIERAEKSALANKLKEDFKDILIYPVAKPIEVIKEIASETTTPATPTLKSSSKK